MNKEPKEFIASEYVINLLNPNGPFNGRMFETEGEEVLAVEKYIEQGKPIKKGDEIAYYPATRKAFHESSKAADELRAMQFSRTFCMGDSNY